MYWAGLLKTNGIPKNPDGQNPKGHMTGGYTEGGAAHLDS